MFNLKIEKFRRDHYLEIIGTSSDPDGNIYSVRSSEEFPTDNDDQVVRNVQIDSPDYDLTEFISDHNYAQQTLIEYALLVEKIGGFEKLEIDQRKYLLHLIGIVSLTNDTLPTVLRDDHATIYDKYLPVE